MAERWLVFTMDAGVVHEARGFAAAVGWVHAKMVYRRPVRRIRAGLHELVGDGGTCFWIATEREARVEGVEIPQRRPHQVFDAGPVAYDVDLAQEILRDAPRAPIDVSVPQLAAFLSLGVVSIDETYLDRVDLAEPLILASVADALMVIDGWHRVGRALRDGCPLILPGYALTVEETARVMGRVAVRGVARRGR